MGVDEEKKAHVEGGIDGEGDGSGTAIHEQGESSLAVLGYTQELKRNRSMFTLLFQSLAIAAIPYGEGGPLISAIYGGGQLSIFVGWLVILVLDECIAVSLGELASRWPTSGGPQYWAFQVAPRWKTVFAYVTGWVWLIGNWTITLSGESFVRVFYQGYLRLLTTSVSSQLRFCKPSKRDNCYVPSRFCLGRLATPAGLLRNHASDLRHLLLLQRSPAHDRHHLCCLHRPLDNHHLDSIIS